MKFVLQWIDLGWLLMGLCLARKDQRLWVLGFFVCSMIMMRMMAELMDSIGYPSGLIGLMETPVLTRGLLIYSVAYVLYMAIVRYSPNAHGTLLMALSLAFFFAAFFICAFVMVL